MPGRLRIRGTIDLAQFWPDGESDADTSKVKVTVDPNDANAFSFAADGKRFRATSAFEGAIVVGSVRRPAIDAKGRVTVRLQGIDAPELHYRAAPLPRDRAGVTPAKREAYNAWNVERRQFWAETATVALAVKLARFGSGGQVRCVVESIVDRPGDVVDTYGRFVGAINVGAGFATDINRWLVADGWAFPTFYSSMSPLEITTLADAATRGRKLNRVPRSLSTDTGSFRASLRYRRNGPIDAATDRGPVLMPKLYRRQVAYRAERAVGLYKGTFRDYLAGRRDECFLTADFLKHGVHASRTYTLDDFMRGNTFGQRPAELVFKEKASTLVDARGRVVTRF